jgi:hypothetical protein
MEADSKTDDEREDKRCKGELVNLMFVEAVAEKHIMHSAHW